VKESVVVFLALDSQLLLALWASESPQLPICCKAKFLKAS
jgi:hypothetical protein